jgi:hypothetical protein
MESTPPKSSDTPSKRTRCSLRGRSKSSSAFSWPWGIATSERDGTAYVSELMRHRIVSIDTDAASPIDTLRVLAGGARSGLADGVGAAAAFQNPGGIALAPGSEFARGGESPGLWNGVVEMVWLSRPS